MIINWKELFKDVDKVRKRRGMTWRGLGRALSIPSCTFTRLGQGRALTAVHLLVLTYSLDLNPMRYVYQN